MDAWNGNLLDFINIIVNYYLALVTKNLLIQCTSLQGTYSKAVVSVNSDVPYLHILAY